MKLDIRKGLKKTIEKELFGRVPEPLQDEFINAGGIIDFDLDKQSLSIENCSDELCQRVKDAIENYTPKG